MAEDWANREKQVGPVTLTSMTPEARDLLDKIMEGWKKHEKALKEQFPKHKPTFYQFAYWLVRFSGLIRPA